MEETFGTFNSQPIDEKLLVQELKKPHPLDGLIKLIRVLCEIVMNYAFSDMTEIWSCISELLSPDKPVEARTVAFQFMISCIKGQHVDNLGFLRVIFYDCIKSHNIPEDFEIKLLALRQLCNDGRDISSFEKNLVKLLSKWVNETVQNLEDNNIEETSQEANNIPISSPSIPNIESILEIIKLDFRSQSNFPSRLQSVVSLLNNVVKFNFAQFEENDIIKLIEDISIACKKSKNVSDIICCLDFWDIVLRFGYVPTNSLKSYIEVLVLCYKINPINQDDKVSQTSWRIIHNLLKSHCAYSTIKILCNNLENSEVVTSEITTILQGSAMILGCAIWGNERIDSLSHTYYIVLSAMNKATKNYKDIKVHLEILTKINDLVTNYIKKITSLEWEIILDILDNTRYHLIENKDIYGLDKKILDDLVEINLDLTDLTEVSEFIISYRKLIFQIQSFHISSSFEGPDSRFIDLIQKLRDYVSENTIIMLLDYYDSENALYPSSPDWLVMLVDVVNTFFIKKSTFKIRRRVLKMAIDVYEITKDIYLDQLIEAVILPMLTKLPEENDKDILTYLMDFLITALKEAPMRWFSTLFKILTQCCKCICVFDQQNSPSHSEICKYVISTVGLITIFQHLLYKSDSSEQGTEVYMEIIKILGDISAPVVCRLSLLQFMVRMRADNDHRIYFVKEIEKIERKGSLKETYELLWQIPENLQFEIFALRPSPYILSYGSSQLDCDEPNKCENSIINSYTENPQKFTVLPLAEYSKCLTDILTNEKDWEIYSYVLYHIPSQLSKQHLFCATSKQILDLRMFLCLWIKNNRLAEGVQLPSNIKKVDIYVVAYQTLTVLISYHNLFNKTQGDELVMTFLAGLQKWTHSAKTCVHALYICLFELPLSATKMLPDIINYLSKIITSATMSVHILEFLSGLARLPDLYVNFTEADFKRVFGIAMQYIQYSHAEKKSSSSSGNAAQSTDALFQYERMMAYHVIYIWFMSLRLSDRPKYVPFIIHGLLVANDCAQQVDEQTETCFDMLARFSFSNCVLKSEQSFINQVLLEHGNNKAKSRTWIQGNALLTIRTMKSLGWAEIIIRRPSGKASFLCKLESHIKLEDVDPVTLSATLMTHYNPDSYNVISLPETVENLISQHSETSDVVRESPRNNIGNLKTNNEDLKNNDKYTGKSTAIKSNENNENNENQNGNEPSVQKLSTRQQQVLEDIFTPNLLNEKANIHRKDEPHVDPSFLFLQFAPYPYLLSREVPIPLPDDGSTTRALSMLDFAQVVDFHKIGVLYVGKDQTTEIEILSNIHGSQDYIDFLNKLGSLVRLKDCKRIYTGGLDTQLDSDGEYAYYWEDDITQVIFHCATLMPTNLNNDPHCSLKKRHIGNDFVTIVFNESGHNYKFDTIPSHFNYINIVISPHSQRHLSQPLNSPTNNTYTFYKVTMQRRTDMPEIGPITEFKMISASALSAFVLAIALHANIFSQVFLQSGGSKKVEYVTNWRDRLRQIKRLKERFKSTNNSNTNSGNVGNEKQQTITINTGENQLESNTILSLEPVLDFTRYT
ncbi:2602_t:CDS:2 [Diversispora eburnea]|uniref:2602_t:CDS:1 n=2 Tax=Diversisporales TaxID=214509 RepID=A0A9N9A573_9GLOM|nr:2602_t:CDS:2 [Diversispora eburnea]